MKVLVLTGSARKGNSSRLADAFIEGAKEAGHEVTRFDCARLKVGGCIGCNHCYKNESICWQNDDFLKIREAVIAADAVVFASPVYYYGLSSQLRAVIDRFYAIDQVIHHNKRTALLISLADADEATAMPSIVHYKGFTGYLDWADAGQVVAYNCTEPDDVLKTDALAKARELGKNI